CSLGSPPECGHTEPAPASHDTDAGHVTVCEPPFVIVIRRRRALPASVVPALSNAIVDAPAATVNLKSLPVCRSRCVVPPLTHATDCTGWRSGTELMCAPIHDVPLSLVANIRRSVPATRRKGAVPASQVTVPGHVMVFEPPLMTFR